MTSTPDLLSGVVPNTGAVPTTAAGRARAFARDIKLSHTVFALPFALLSTFLAAGGWPRPGQLLLILLCMVCARTFAMAVNRLLDARLDADNPRTAGRALPSGMLSRRYVLLASIMCTIGFIAATAGFAGWYHNPWPLALSMPVLVYLGAYPLMKRFTRFCHYYLGLALGLAPVCAWLAVRGSLAPPPLWMCAAVLCWTAGFDIIYACQDYDCDVRMGVFSVPARLGIPKALWIARLTHVVAVACLIGLARSTPLFGIVFYAAVAITTLLLIIEHTLVRNDDLSRVGLAFFTLNGIISAMLGVMGIVDVFT